MPHALRLALGLLTLVPCAVLLVTLARLYTWVVDLLDRGGTVSGDVLDRFVAEMTLLQGGAAVLTLLLLLGYLAHLLVLRAATPPGEKLLWLVALLGFSVFAMPVYWYLHLGPAARPATASGRAARRPAGRLQ